jgi:hypothetical protein
MTRGVTNGVIQTAANCAAGTVVGASSDCPSFNRVASTTTPVNFTQFTTAGTGTQTGTFTINTAGCNFVGASASLLCLATVPLNTIAATQSTTVQQSGVGTGNSYFVYLAVSCG